MSDESWLLAKMVAAEVKSWPNWKKAGFPDLKTDEWPCKTEDCQGVAKSCGPAIKLADGVMRRQGRCATCHCWQLEARRP